MEFGAAIVSVKMVQTWVKKGEKKDLLHANQIIDGIWENENRSVSVAGLTGIDAVQTRDDITKFQILRQFPGETNVQSINIIYYQLLDIILLYYWFPTRTDIAIEEWNVQHWYDGYSKNTILLLHYMLCPWRAMNLKLQLINMC